MACYKIIKTYEKSGICFSAVPEKWEKNKLLRWPQHLNIKQLDKLRADPLSTPAENWTRSPCKVVAVASTFVEGRQLEIVFSNFDDKEAEEMHLQQNKRVRKQRLSCPQKDFDKMFDNGVATGDSTPERNGIIDEIEEHTLVLNECFQEVNVKTEETEEIDEASENPIEEISISQVLMGFQNDMLKIANQMQCFENRFNKLDKSVAEINFKLGILLQNSPNANKLMPSDIGNRLVEELQFPLKHSTDVEILNTRLHFEEALKIQLVSQLSRIGGTSNSADGGKLIFKIIDYLFEPELMRKYSWTGSSKSSEQKFSFRKYSRIIDLIFEVIYMADCRHSRERNEEFLRDKILRHTLQRLQSKRKNEVNSPNLCEMLPDKENSNQTNNDNEVPIDDGDVEASLSEKKPNELIPSDIGNRLVEELQFPLKHTTDVENLNTRLNVEEALKIQLISQLSSIGGTSKNADGAKIIYKIIDYMFEPELMLKYSWTGSSKSSEQKFSFRKYSLIIDLIFEVIYMADCRHSRERNEEFLKDKVLRHTLQRLQSKRKNEANSKKLCKMLSDKENLNQTNVDNEISIDDGDGEASLSEKRANEVIPSDIGNPLVEELQFPLNHTTDVENLNTRLHVEKALEIQLISQLSRIGGRSKTADGAKLIYKIIDYMFEPELMLKYSWTGSSKSSEQKFSFKKYSRIIDVIFEVIYMADCRHSKERNEEFLKDKVLKHTLQRLKRKRRKENLDQNVDNEVPIDDGDVEASLSEKRAK